MSEENVAATPGTRRLRLTRSIVLGGEHAEEGTICEVSRSLAARLVGEGSAVHHVEEGEEAEPQAATVNRMEHPTNADPAPQQIKPAPPKVRSHPQRESSRQ